MSQASSYTDEGPALAEAVRRHRIGLEAKNGSSKGLTAREMSVLTGLGIPQLNESVLIAERYPDPSTFLAAFEAHTIPQGAHHKSWATFLYAENIGRASKESAAEAFSTIKTQMEKIVLAANAAESAAWANELLGAIRAWIVTRLPTSAWASIDRNFFQYAPCSSCGADYDDGVLIDMGGLLAPLCRTCVAEGGSSVAINYETVAKAYAAYAQECERASDIYRGG